MHSLTRNLFVGIVEAKKIIVVIYVTILIVVESILEGLVRIIINFELPKTILKNDKDEVIYWIKIIAILKCVDHFTTLLRETMYKRDFEIPMELYFKEKFMKNLFLNSDPTWLNQNKCAEINTAIESGTRSLMTSLRFMITIVRPIIRSIIMLWYMNEHVGSLFALNSLMIVILCAGTYLLMDEYHQLKKVNAKTNPLISFNIYLSETFLSSLLNGRGKETITEILNNSTENEILHEQISSQTNKRYASLDIVGTIFMAVIVISFANSNIDAATLIAASMSIRNIFNMMWNLFHRFASASKNAAKWSALENYLKNVERPTYYRKSELKSYQINNCNSSEYHIIGDSATGKTTWMIKEVINLFKYHHLTWGYMEQHCKIPSTTCMTIRRYLNIGDHQDKCLQLAKMLMLEKIINKDTFNKPFQKPSGG